MGIIQSIYESICGEYEYRDKQTLEKIAKKICKKNSLELRCVSSSGWGKWDYFLVEAREPQGMFGLSHKQIFFSNKELLRTKFGGTPLKKLI